MDLLVLAAGMGSRFGGMKQTAKVGKNGEFILDYSIYDAIKAGFKRVIFVIKEEHLALFKETIGNRISKFIEVEYAFQKLDDIPIKVPKGREKPWGTVQAILCAKDKIKKNFAVINADDFYGRNSFVKAYDELKTLNKDNVFSAVLFKAVNTLSENGKVKRGLCEIKGENVQKLIESEIEMVDDMLSCVSLDDGKEYIASIDSLVSMNMFLFNKSIFKVLLNDFYEFFDNIKDELKDECLISSVLNYELSSKNIQLNYVLTDEKWYGITYKEDLSSLIKGIKELIIKGEYNEDLWG